MAHMNLDYWEEQIKATLVTAAHLAVPVEYGFTLTATPPSRAIAPGGVATYTLEVQPVGGFTATVDLVAASPSPSLVLDLTPAAVVPPGQATLIITDTHVGTLVPGLWFTVPITATGNGITRATSVSLLIEGGVNGFTLTAAPPSRAIAPGGVATYTLEVQPVGGFTAGVDLFAASPSPSLALDLTPATVVPPSQATLTITDTHLGTLVPGLWFTVPITATGNGITRATSVSLFVEGGVNGFTLTAAPPSRTIAPGGVATYTLEVQPVGGFTATVNLVAASPSPSLALDLTPATVVPPGQATLVITDTHVGTLVPGLWFIVPITATGNGITRATSVSLLIEGRVRVYLPLILRASPFTEESYLGPESRTMDIEQSHLAIFAIWTR